MSLNDVRRQRRSSSRAKRAASSAASGRVMPAHGTGSSSVERSTPIRPGAPSASSRSRVTAARSLGVCGPFAATVPSSARANSRRESAESRALAEPAHHTTA